MAGDTTSAAGRTPLERRTAAAALASAPVIVALGVVAALTSPEAVSGETDPTAGGIAFGAGMFVLATAVPQLLFGLALRSGAPTGLTATAVAAPIWAVWFGLLPLVSGLVEGWEGTAPVAIGVASAAAVLDGFVVVAARRGLRRSGRHGGGAPRGGGRPEGAG